MFPNKNLFIEKVSSLFFITGITIFVLYSPSILLEIPFFKISHLEINVKNRKIKRLVQNIIEKNFKNNWLLLKLNQGKFNQILRKRSQFFIERANIEAFSFKNGNLKLQLALNKPLYFLNGKFFLAENGRIFHTDVYKFINLPLLVDRTFQWKLGDLFNQILLNQLKEITPLIKPSLISIGKYKITFEGKNLTISAPISKLQYIKMVGILQKDYANSKVYLNLFGEKSFAVKIFKE